MGVGGTSSNPAPMRAGANAGAGTVDSLLCGVSSIWSERAHRRGDVGSTLASEVMGAWTHLKTRGGEQGCKCPPWWVQITWQAVAGSLPSPGLRRAASWRRGCQSPARPLRRQAQPRSRPRRGPPAMLTQALPAELPDIPDRSPPLRSTRLSPGPPFLCRRAFRPHDRQQPDHLRSARPLAVTAHRSAWHLFSVARTVPTHTPLKTLDVVVTKPVSVARSVSLRLTCPRAGETSIAHGPGSGLSPRPWRGVSRPRHWNAFARAPSMKAPVATRARCLRFAPAAGTARRPRPMRLWAAETVRA